MRIVIENASFKVSNNEILKGVDMQIDTGGRKVAERRC